MYLDGGVRAFPTGLSLSELRYGCIPHDGDFGLHRNEKKNAHGSDTHTHTHQLKKMKVRNSHAYIFYFTTGKSNLRRIALKSSFGDVPSSCSAI